MDENKQEQMVSIIVPVYNAEAYLPEMIESVIFQNYNNWELLLIDNCSMDNSFEICQSYEKKDVRIRVMQETEKGPAAVRNHGLLAAHGGYIMFLDADDFLADNAVLDRFVNVMGKKAYLFCRDLDACKRAAMMYSLFGACKVLDKNPERWLCYVLKHIDSTPEDKYYTLLPEFWEDEEQ